MEQVELLQEAIASAIVACSARQVDILKIAAATTRMRQDVVILSPHALECCMLRGICSFPRHGLGILFSDCDPDFAPDHRYLAESTVVAVSLMDQVFRFLCCVSCLALWVLGSVGNSFSTRRG